MQNSGIKFKNPPVKNYWSNLKIIWYKWAFKAVQIILIGWEMFIFLTLAPVVSVLDDKYILQDNHIHDIIWDYEIIMSSCVIMHDIIAQ